MRRKKAALQGFAFAGIFLLLFGYVTRMFVPEFFYDQLWCTTATYQGFYELEKNSVDVLFLGSSASATAFAPQELYDRYGIVSYNLSCEQQSLFTSYYWLKEALRFQQPQAVVLETSMFFPRIPEAVLNSTEGCMHKAFDSMKMSPVKYEAVQTLCKLDDTQYLPGYLLPVMRFHTRWKELSRKDFGAYYKKMSAYHALRGWTPAASYVSKDVEYVPFRADGAAGGYEEPDALMLEYFQKISALCGEHHITLLLTQIPSVNQTLERHNWLQDYAEQNGLDFVDFNEQSLYASLNLDFYVDNYDVNHTSYAGSQKLTDYIGGMLAERYGLQARTDENLERTRECYRHVIDGCELTHISDVDAYLDQLQTLKGNYDILISVKDDATQHLREETIQRLRKLGFQADLQGRFRYSYVGILSGENVVEQCQDEKIQVHGYLTGSRTPYQVVSGGYDHGNVSQIKIYGQQVSKNGRGLTSSYMTTKEDGLWITWYLIPARKKTGRADKLLRSACEKAGRAGAAPERGKR